MNSSISPADKCNKGRLIVPVKCCDILLRPTQPLDKRGNKNINSLIRQYLPKGMDLSVYSQEELDTIVFGLNICPRKKI